MKKFLKVAAIVLVVLVLVGAGGYVWASSATSSILDRTIEVHEADFPIPTPLDPAEVDSLGLTDDEAADLATERAIERGRHLVEARYACTDCHGEDFGGGVMIDDPPVGVVLGPNLTTGEGGIPESWTGADWDRIVRHGVRRDGRPTLMPAQDFIRMSDRELSDIVTYIRAQPPVDDTVPPVQLGPVGRVLVATGQFVLASDRIEHDVTHPAEPPPAAVTVEFGEHLAATCVGCHREDYGGGPIVGGDPSWAPARNLTPHETGLAGWTFDDFEALMRQGRRPDGSGVLAPMSLVIPFGQRMTDTELRAMWTYLQTVPPVEREVERPVE